MSDPVLIALIGTIVPSIASICALIVGILNLRKIEVVHKSTNSMKDQLVAVTRSDAKQEGKAEGKAEEKAKQAGKDEQSLERLRQTEFERSKREASP